MLRGYRGLAIASGLGALIWAAAFGFSAGSLRPVNQPKTYQRYHNTEPKLREAAATGIDKSAPEYKTPCRNPEGKDESDLCAQWHAAEAAKEAADWAWHQLWLSAFGVAGLAITLWFNFRALRLAERESEETKGALAIARENADAAHLGAASAARAAASSSENNRIARETMQRQLRPYVYISDQTVSFRHMHSVGMTEDVADVDFTICNFKESPAKNVKFAAHAVVGGYWSDRPSEIVTDALIPLALVPLADIPPKHKRYRPGYAVTGLKEAYPEICGATKSIFLEGQIQYADDFGNTYVTNFQLAMTGREHESEPPSATPHWNNAT